MKRRIPYTRTNKDTEGYGDGKPKNLEAQSKIMVGRGYQRTEVSNKESRISER